MKKPGSIRVDLMTTHPPRPEHFTVLHKGRVVATLSPGQLHQALREWESYLVQQRHWQDTESGDNPKRLPPRRF